jgi:hypothetical protein
MFFVDAAFFFNFCNESVSSLTALGIIQPDIHPRYLPVRIHTYSRAGRGLNDNSGLSVCTQGHGHGYQFTAHVHAHNTPGYAARADKAASSLPGPSMIMCPPGRPLALYNSANSTADCEATKFSFGCCPSIRVAPTIWVHITHACFHLNM